MREQLGLSFGYVRKLLGQHHRDALMEPTPATADECRVCGLLCERMLEDEARFAARYVFVDELVPIEFMERRFERDLLVPYRPQQSQRELRPITDALCKTLRGQSDSRSMRAARTPW